MERSTAGCSGCTSNMLSWWIVLTVLVLASGSVGHSQTPPPEGLYFTLRDTVYLPRDTVNTTDIGEFINPNQAGDALVCVTTNVNTQCCRTSDGGNVGEWYDPDGTIVPRGGSSMGFFRTGATQQVRLNRLSSVMPPVGAYECRVPDSNGTEQVAAINIVAQLPTPTTAPPTTPATAPPTTPTTPPPTTPTTAPPTTTPPDMTTASPTTAPTTAPPTTPPALYFSLNGTMYTDGATIYLPTLSSTALMGPLICETEHVNRDCCQREQTGGSVIGEWFYNGEMVSTLDGSGSSNLYRNRGPQQVILNFKDAMLAEGVYRCEVPNSQGAIISAVITIVNELPPVETTMMSVVSTTTAPPPTSTTDSERDPEGQGTNVGVAVGVVIVFAALIVIIVVVAVFILLWWRRRRTEPYNAKKLLKRYPSNSMPLKKVVPPTPTAYSAKNGVHTTSLNEGVDGAGIPARAVPVAEFGAYVADLHGNNNKGFKKQYDGLSTGDKKHTTNASSAQHNRVKNRFGNILVYDANRIVLEKCPELPPEEHNDYINASYIDGYSSPQRFIATQGPLPKTVVDFWRLVWQERPPTIVMVTNLKEGMRVKCEEYWPTTGHQQIGPYNVAITEQQVLADYTLRTFSLKREDDSGAPLKIRQYHFTAWPDHGVPDYATPILAFLRRVRSEHASKSKGKHPILIHCSAGVGRTGTLIALDIILDQIAQEGVVNVGGVVEKMRTQRINMVQTEEQYVFIHDAVLEWLTCGDTQITPTNLRRELVRLDTVSADTQLTGYEQQFKVLEQVSPQPDKVECKVALSNPQLNRGQEFLPPDRWRAVLRGTKPDYIHAITAHGYKHQRAYLMAQTPLPATTRNFYQLVFDRMVSCVVQLTGLKEGGKEACAPYWPSALTETEKRFGEFSVELEHEDKQDGYVIRTFSLVKDQCESVHQLTQFQFTCWNGDGTCSNLKAIIDVVADMTRIQRKTGNKPILITCNDTVSRSALFCAIATTIERCKTESVVDIFQVVKALRVHRPGAVRTVEQYKLIFEALLVFLDSFDNYANFQ